MNKKFEIDLGYDLDNVTARRVIRTVIGRMYGYRSIRWLKLPESNRISINRKWLIDLRMNCNFHPELIQEQVLECVEYNYRLEMAN